jgi:hypothetical protein
MSTAADDSRAMTLVTWITDRAIQGIGPLCSAQALADEYLNDQRYQDHRHRVDSLINWETTKNFTSGFVTGLGGLITLPIALPAAFGASWLIQARMSAAIARIGGNELDSDRIRTFVLICLVGDAFKDIAKTAGIQVGQRLTRTVISQIPGRILIQINKLVGFRLITKAGEKGIINLMKWIPLAGGFVGGTFDAVACRTVGATARELFCCEGLQTI